MEQHDDASSETSGRPGSPIEAGAGNNNQMQSAELTGTVVAVVPGCASATGRLPADLA